MKRLFFSMVLLSLISWTGSAEAGTGGIFFKIHGGISSLNPDDVNDGLDRLNQEAGGSFMDPIGSALDAGLSLGFALSPDWDMGLEYARLWAGSEFSGDGYLFKYDLSANLYDVFIDYLPAAGGKVRFGAGVNAGMIQSAASWQLDDAVVSEKWEIPLDGSGFLFSGYGLVEAGVSANWSLAGQAGFRHAVINTVRIEGETVLNPDSLDDKLRFSYSGFYLRVGVKFQP